MLFFLVSFLSFILLLTKLFLLQLPSWVSEMKLLSLLLLQESLAHLIHFFKTHKLTTTLFLQPSSKMIITKKNEPRPDVVVVEEEAMNLLDMPELALDLILEKLNPEGLLSVSNVCTSLRERCTSDYLWERHFRERWGRVIGESARREWEFYFDSLRESKKNGVERSNWVMETILRAWPCSWFVKESGSHLLIDDDDDDGVDVDDDGGGDCVMAWYLALESGRFWFPAQVYNRENGHVGFMLSCYDAELSYDSHTDTFKARYPPHGQRGTNMEEGVEWERLRAPPVSSPAHDLHISKCLNDLRPGDHIEIQWRRNKEFPYGWWYGVVGHLESCDGDEHHCRCYNSDTVVLEFNQYSPGSRWRRTVIGRKDHREEGNESDGFYGGIRKLHDKYEISTWRRLWPTEILE
ncbi:uncharacterized protein A4U43_C02F19650 [Asparagus officinalis]|uniref:F-box domain-containing protein n=1 Tax=Asparagus officinalis TaxID=4686 RepID=A0A5P1FPA3_ASPOF|nr:F-box protein At2g32560-like isoform X2 [Asparagus officinalis]ONK78521.1 uncharacterized protein A4U43_C02F19650 [Asparagus officinalis]